MINKLEWYEKQGIDIGLRTTIDKIDLRKKQLYAGKAAPLGCSEAVRHYGTDKASACGLNLSA
jgi:hypothetical protein